MEIDHPTREDIDNFLFIQQKKNNPYPFSITIPETLAATAFYFALFGTFFVNVNPYGRASRIRYEQTLNPVWRYSRKLLPFGMLLSGLAFYDIQNGLL